MSSVEKTVLAIDPGTSKCGLALVRRREDNSVELLWRCIVPTVDLCAAVDDAEGVAAFTLAIVGSGTSSQAVVEQVRAEKPSVGILVVNEKDTTIQARERYWEHHRRRGWRRFLPASMQVPPEPIDDFAALVIAERVLVE